MWASELLWPVKRKKGFAMSFLLPSLDFVRLINDLFLASLVKISPAMTFYQFFFLKQTRIRNKITNLSEFQDGFILL